MGRPSELPAPCVGPSPNLREHGPFMEARAASCPRATPILLFVDPTRELLPRLQVLLVFPVGLPGSNARGPLRRAMPALALREGRPPGFQ